MGIGSLAIEQRSLVSSEMLKGDDYSTGNMDTRNRIPSDFENALFTRIARNMASLVPNSELAPMIALPYLSSYSQNHDDFSSPEQRNLVNIISAKPPGGVGKGKE